MVKLRLRATRVRTAVRAILEKTHRPLSHMEILHLLGPQDYDRVTVYRALKALESVGLLHRVQGPDGIWRFRANRIGRGVECAGNHAHFLCDECGRMSCMTGQALPWLRPPPGALILNKQYVACGYCAACACKRKHKGGV